MLDNLGKTYHYFEKFVNTWRAHIKSKRKLNGEEYDAPMIYLEMDRNFFDYLFDIYKTQIVEQNGIHISNDEIENLKKLYTGEPNIQEFVLLPRKIYSKIIDDREEKNKKANEVLSLLFPDNSISDF